MRSRDITGSNTALSFIDVLASALGAAVLLFVILASTPVSVGGHAQAAGAFIRFEWTVSSDPGALLRLQIRSPLNPSLPPIELSQFNGHVIVPCAIPGIDSYALIGFGESAAPSSPAGANSDRTYILRLNKPIKGMWAASVIYYDRAGGITARPKDITVTTAVSFDSNAQRADNSIQLTDVHGTASPGSNTSQLMHFGDELRAPTIMEVGATDGVAPSGCR